MDNVISYSGLCSSCARIPLWEASNFERNGQALHVGQLAHSTMSHLRDSATSGCRFCEFIWESMRQNWAYIMKDMRFPWKSIEDARGDMSVHISCSPKSLWVEARLNKGDPITRITHFGAGFNIFTAVDDPMASSIKLRPMALDFGGPVAMAKARALIAECEKSHQRCCSKGTPRLPSRVIDVGAEDSPQQVKLHVSAAEEEYHEYATLSYCWGGKQPVVATRANISNLECGIDLETLPQTLHDAVTTTRALGLKYLWVDALCILQDCDEDKFREIRKMGAIYQDSKITISAARASNVHEGLLRYEPKVCTVQVPVRGHGLGHISFVQECYPDFKKLPLNLRGWAVQETILSKRLLVYGHHEAVWRCKTTDCAPLLPTYIDKINDTEMHELVPRISLENLIAERDTVYSGGWRDLLRDYSNCSVSIPEDRRHAISGIVALLEEAWDDKCIYGLWESRFGHDLAWEKVSFSRHSLARSPNSNIPSWSWMSLEGPVTGGEVGTENLDVTVQGDCLASVSQDGRLLLNCYLTKLNAKFKTQSGQKERLGDLVPHLKGQIRGLGKLSWDLDHDETNDSPLYFLLIGRTLETGCQGLMVVEVDEKTFRRVGNGKISWDGQGISLSDFDFKLDPSPDFHLDFLRWLKKKVLLP